MALRNQPYIPLYVQDVLTDEKLIECSIQSHGLYFRLICILHKQAAYGKICLKQKYKQNTSKYESFAMMLQKQMPFKAEVIKDCLIELAEESVINITNDELWQKRMVKDGEISAIRAEVGKRGGSSVTKQYGKSGFLYLMSNYYDLCKIGISINPQNRLYRIRSDFKLKVFDIIKKVEVSDMGVAEDIVQEYFLDIRDGEWINHNSDIVLTRFNKYIKNIEAKIQAKVKANSEDEDESLSNINSSLAKEKKTITSNEGAITKHFSKEKKVVPRKRVFVKPTLEQVIEYFKEKLLKKKLSDTSQVDGETFFNHFESVGWVKGEFSKPVVCWKSTISTWILKNEEKKKDKPVTKGNYPDSDTIQELKHNQL